MPLRKSNVLYQMIDFCSFMTFHTPSLIECYASMKGLGCVLLQPMDKNVTDYGISNFSEKDMEEFLQHLRPPAYSSKLLSDAET